ncbi:hypothetical protein ACJX0J_019117, partial [Zea mays]
CHKERYSSTKIRYFLYEIPTYHSTFETYISLQHLLGQYMSKSCFSSPLQGVYTLSPSN